MVKLLEMRASLKFLLCHFSFEVLIRYVIKECFLVFDLGLAKLILLVLLIESQELFPLDLKLLNNCFLLSNNAL